LGGQADTGWLVDTFGHISQSPQMHRQAGIGQVYLWRGVPELEPYFHWQAPDGSTVLAIYLLGGYRNLYGVTHVPEAALTRLAAEVERLKPYYTTPEIPLFDGYDLEDDPEDPLSFYQETGLPPGMNLIQSTPKQFIDAVRMRELKFPVRQHELNSGKYGATFPGTLSSRIYLKLMAHDCERLLYRVCEPLAAMAHPFGRAYPAQQFEGWSRALLQNAVHDGICGVSIDGVHEKMEFIYRQVFDGALADVQAALDALAGTFQPGDYAISLSPIAGEAYQAIGDQMGYTHTSGMGIWPVKETAPIERPNLAQESFHWQNEHYTAEVSADGVLRIGPLAFGRLTVHRELGDTYSEESGELLGTLVPASPLMLLEQSRWHAVVGFDATWSEGEGRVTAGVRMKFDPSPIVSCTIDLDSRGSDLRVDLCIEHTHFDSIYAGMPFDIVLRSGVDRDLLPERMEGDLADILLGQRELNQVRTFPFQDFVALQGEQTTAIFARGLRAYTLDDGGQVRLPLRRSVEWLTRAGLGDRVGDAGPFFYVPDARCERSERHELGIAIGACDGDSPLVAALNDQFQNPPLLVRFEGSGRARDWAFFEEGVPLTGMQMEGGRILSRVYNPSGQSLRLAQTYRQVDFKGQPEGEIDSIAPKKIVRLEIDAPELPEVQDDGRARLLNPPLWRVGESASRPDPAVIDLLGEKAAERERLLAEVNAELEHAEGARKLRLQHRAYVLEREMVEYLFSRLLNQKKLAREGAPSDAELFQPDADIAALGLRLNKLRIKRRIYDYVVGVLRD
jgi:alpha-mannosidase